MEKLKGNTTLLSKSKSVAYIAIFSALYLIFRLIPTFPILGIGSFRLSDILPSLLTVLFGPLIAVLSITLGTALSFFIAAPSIFFGMDFIPASVNAIIIGGILKRRKTFSTIIFLLLIICFSVSPFGVVLVFDRFPFLWLHLIALILLLSPTVSRCRYWIEHSSGIHLALAFAVVSFIGTMGQHIAGSLLTTLFYSRVISQIGLQIYWRAVFFLYPVERISITALSTLLGVSILRALQKTGFNYLIPSPGSVDDSKD
ncbi:ECF transporter S component [[Eubacterium] cellulosolvens]